MKNVPDPDHFNQFVKDDDVIPQITALHAKQYGRENPGWEDYGYAEREEHEYFAVVNRIKGIIPDIQGEYFVKEKRRPEAEAEYYGGDDAVAEYDCGKNTVEFIHIAGETCLGAVFFDSFPEAEIQQEGIYEY